MSTFYSGAGSKLSAGLQANYFNNSATSVNTRLNITSATFDPSVEKVSEETLLMSKTKSGSLLASIGMEGSFDANLRPSMTEWLFKAVTQNTSTVDLTDDDLPSYIEDTFVTDAPTGYDCVVYALKDAGNDPLGSTFVLTKGDKVTTYPGMTVRSMTLNAPNNDFVTVSTDLVGREEIQAGGTSAIPAGAVPATTYVAKTDTSDDLGGQSYIVTSGVFMWNGTNWCIEDSTISIDNGIEDSPRCYQDGKYANIPVMGMRAVTVDFNLPYDQKIETLKEDYLLTSEYGSATLEFRTPEAEPESIIRILIPKVSITSVGAGISGTGVIEASVSGEGVQATGTEGGESVTYEPILIGVYTKSNG